MLKAYRQATGRAIGAAAVPYGFTLTVFASGAAANHFNPSASLGRILLFVLGACGAYLLLVLISAGARADGPAMNLHWVGACQVLAIAPATLAAWGIASLASGAVGWLLPGFCGALVFFACDAALVVAWARR